jgi:hypothetical protein
MATDLGPQTKPAPKYETFVDRQIARARGRIRALDVAALGLVFLLATLAYGLAMTLLDRALDMPPFVRLAALIGYAAVLLLVLAVAGFRLLARRVNPYYAARQIEQTLPGAKNSVVNWLDLRGADLPPAIRGALGQRAAKDLKRADLDRAISARRTVGLGGAALALGFVLLALYLLGGGQFVSLLARAFAPFREVDIATRTTLTVLEPQGGHTTVVVGRPVKFRVRVEGRVPRVNQADSVKLLYRYNPGDPFLEQGLEHDADSEWATTMPADQVQNGFWYRLTAGDAGTPEYQVRVRSLPQVTRFEVNYHYRPYRNRPDKLVRYPNEHAVWPHVTAHRGTDVTLTALANRPVREGHLEMELGGVRKDLPGEVPASAPDTMRFRFTLDQDGTYRVLFTSQDGERNTDRSPYRIEVVADQKPVVELTKPGKDVELPANGTLRLEGRAEDDFGIKGLTLRLHVANGPVLEPKVYRAGKSFRLETGDYPDKLDYKDFVALEKLKNEAGAAVSLKPGMELKYWLEAADNCDYPDPAGNVGRSKEFTVKITEPGKDKKQQQKERQQASQEQQQHEHQQDKKLEQQNQAAKQKQAEQGGQGEDKQDGSGRAGSEKQKDFENKAKQLADAVKEKEKQDQSKGQAKGDSASEPKGGSKERGEQGGANAGDKKEQQPAGNQEAGSQKDEGKGGQQTDKGQAKDAGQPQGAREQAPSQGQAKDSGQQGAAGHKAAAKDDGAGSKQGNPAQGAKGADKESPREQVGQSKDQGAGNQPTPAAQAKDGGQKGAEQKQAQAKGAGNDAGAPQKAAAKDDGKGNAGTPQPAKSEAKAGPKDQVAQARDQGSKNHQPEPSRAKGPGEPQAKQQPAQGHAKGQEQAAPKGAAKSGDSPTGDAAPKADARQGGPDKSAPEAASKPAPPEQARDAGLAKGERQGTQQTAAEKQRQDATMEDVARLRESLKQGNQKQQAADELSRIGKEARDAQVRQAAEDALKQAGAEASAQGSRPEPGQTKGDNSPPDKVASGSAKGSGQPDKSGPPSANSNAKSGPPKNDAGSDKGPGQSGKNDLAKGQPKDKGDVGGAPLRPGTGDFGDQYRRQAGNQEFAGRGGVLQLEELKKKVTPDILKKLNWTEQDWQRFQEQARRYEAGLRRQQQAAGKDKIRPGSSLLPSTSPRKVGTGTDPRADDLSAGQALPPPEFREAQRVFTSRPEGAAPAPGKN